MKPYAETTDRRAWQVALDLAVLLWTFVWVQLGLALHNVIDAFVQPGRRVEEAGRDVAVAADDAGNQVSDLPLVGSQLAAPFEAFAEAARDVAEAGAAQQEATARVADVAGIGLALFPIALVVIVWLWWRWRWVREASAAARLRDAGGASQLFALRALAGMPFADLATLGGDDPARLTSPETAEELAAMHLRSLGLYPHRRTLPPG